MSINSGLSRSKRLTAALVPILLLGIFCSQDHVLAEWDKGSLSREKAIQISNLYYDRLPTGIDAEKRMIRQFALVMILADSYDEYFGQGSAVKEKQHYKVNFLRSKVLRDLLSLHWRAQLAAVGIELPTVRYLQSNSKFAAAQLNTLRNDLIAGKSTWEDIFELLIDQGQKQEKTAEKLQLPLSAFPDNLKASLRELISAKRNKSRVRYFTPVIEIDGYHRFFELLQVQNVSYEQLVSVLGVHHSDQEEAQRVSDEFWSRAEEEYQTSQLRNLLEGVEFEPLPSDWERRGVLDVPNGNPVSITELRETIKILKDRQDLSIEYSVNQGEQLARYAFKYIQTDRILVKEAVRLNLHKHTEFPLRIQWEQSVHLAEKITREKLLPMVKVSDREIKEAAQKVVETLFPTGYAGNIASKKEVLAATRRKLQFNGVGVKKDEILQNVNFRFTGERL